MGQKETKVSDAVRLELCKRGCKVFRSQVGLFYTQYGEMINIGIKGESDLHGHRPDGKAFYVETKTLTGTKRKEQEKFIRSNAKKWGFSRICSFS